jgi:hypothetical protein
MEAIQIENGGNLPDAFELGGFGGFCGAVGSEAGGFV